MRSTNLRKLLAVLMTGGCLYGDVSCIPNRDQINATISGGVLNGIELALTLAVESILTPVLGGDGTAADILNPTDGTADQTQG